MDEPASYSCVSIIHLYCMLPKSTRCSIHRAGRLRFREQGAVRRVYIKYAQDTFPHLAGAWCSPLSQTLLLCPIDQAGAPPGASPLRLARGDAPAVVFTEALQLQWLLRQTGKVLGGLQLWTCMKKQHLQGH